MAHLLDSQEKFEKDLAGNEDFAAQFAPGIEDDDPLNDYWGFAADSEVRKIRDIKEMLQAFEALY